MICDHKLIREQNGQLSELLNRNFAGQWNFNMRILEVECPSTFSLVPEPGSIFDPREWIKHTYRVHLICQNPSGPHPVGEGYQLKEPMDWWESVSPWLNHMIKVLKFAVPMGKAIGELCDPDLVEEMKASIGLLEQITRCFPKLESSSESRIELQAVGSALRALRKFLEKIDPARKWGGLENILTPDGNILWLCPEHRKVYEAKPVQLPEFTS